MKVATMAAVMAVMVMILSGGCRQGGVDDMVDDAILAAMLEEMNDACEAHCEHDEDCESEMYWTTPCRDVCLGTYDELEYTDRWECAEFYAAEFRCLSRAPCDELGGGFVCEDEWFDTIDCLYPED